MGCYLKRMVMMAVGRDVVIILWHARQQADELDFISSLARS